MTLFERSIVTKMAVACPESNVMLEQAPHGSAEYPWYALRVRTKFEKTAATLLSRKGYEPFLPTTRVTRRWSDRVKVSEEALFPGYVFCRLDIEKRLPCLMMPNVLEIVGCGKIPQPVPDVEVNSILSLVRSGKLLRPWPFLRVGQRVAIERGPLAGVQGILIAMNDGFRIVLSVELLQRSVIAEVEADWVLPIRSKAAGSAHFPDRAQAQAG